MEKLEGRENKKTENKDSKRRFIEAAASQLAEIFVAQLEFQKNKDKNGYEKRR